MNILNCMQARAELGIIFDAICKAKDVHSTMSWDNYVSKLSPLTVAMKAGLVLAKKVNISGKEQNLKRLNGSFESYEELFSAKGYNRFSGHQQAIFDYMKWMVKVIVHLDLNAQDYDNIKIDALTNIDVTLLRMAKDAQLLILNAHKEECARLKKRNESFSDYDNTLDADGWVMPLLSNAFGSSINDPLMQIHVNEAVQSGVTSDDLRAKFDEQSAFYYKAIAPYNDDLELEGAFSDQSELNDFIADLANNLDRVSLLCKYVLSAVSDIEREDSKLLYTLYREFTQAQSGRLKYKASKGDYTLGTLSDLRGDILVINGSIKKVLSKVL